MFILVTRHKGTVQWIKSMLREPIKHIFRIDDFTILSASECVIGTLPFQLIAEMYRRRIRFLYLSVDIPAHWRSIELTTVQLVKLCARLEELHVVCMNAEFEPLINTIQYESHQ